MSILTYFRSFKRSLIILGLVLSSLKPVYAQEFSKGTQRVMQELKAELKKPDKSAEDINTIKKLLLALVNGIMNDAEQYIKEGDYASADTCLRTTEESFNAAKSGGVYDQVKGRYENLLNLLKEKRAEEERMKEDAGKIMEKVSEFEKKYKKGEKVFLLELSRKIIYIGHGTAMDETEARNLAIQDAESNLNKFLRKNNKQVDDKTSMQMGISIYSEGMSVDVNSNYAYEIYIAFVVDMN